MRPIPSTSRREDSNDTVPVDDFQRKVRHQMSIERKGDDLESAVEAVLLNSESPPSDTESQEFEDIKQRGIEAIRDGLPESFEYEVVSGNGFGLGLHVKAGCPDCGNTAIFNTQIEHPHAQLIGRSSAADEFAESQFHDTDAEGVGTVCTIDDAEVRFTFIGCGNCGSVLVNDDDDEGSEK